MTGPLVQIENLTVRYPLGGGLGARGVLGLAPTNLEVQRGELLAIVGESGSGKTTLGRAMLRLIPAEGAIHFDGTEIIGLGRRELAQMRSRMQMIFQDPYSSLNPQKTVGRTLSEVLAHVGIPRAERRARAEELLSQVGLGADAYPRLPRAFSGGQRQRIAIARALATGPDLVVADEPVSALDVSVQAQVVNLLLDLKAERGLTMVFISHDLGLVSAIADRIGVMYFGRLVEIGPAARLSRSPAHPYTALLNDSMPPPSVAAARATLEAAAQTGAVELPSLMDPPRGCPFAPRCGHASASCRETPPALHPHPAGGLVACHHPLNTD
ncbi:ABC transporter ATP-binding protein [uncultured Marivita sp.]|uniref:oligopeptide/dipeptide ABC transporter ATP-binding protein n=1 Tax=uncultured Marivita sp. TaxID=888080 RepID=UPI00263865E5|nr:ABC transporter ATP-binding protein [uncultured Marivita sp.]